MRDSAGPRRPAGQELPADHPLRLPTDELNKRAGSALVAVDDAIRSSEEELAFAKAQFGLQATDTFSSALDDAKDKAGQIGRASCRERAWSAEEGGGGARTGERGRT